MAGGESYVETPVSDARINTTLDFWVKRDADSDGSEQILFESSIGAIKAVQKETGKFGFSRDFRDYSFDYTLPKGERRKPVGVFDHPAEPDWQYDSGL